jgi:hypothetical protein
MFPVLVPTFEKLRFRFKNVENCFVFLLSELFYKEKVYKFQKIYCKM